jgi:hypothetical protein
MAEIKSTMEMVLERAAKMAEDAPTISENEDTVKTGMRLAAEYLNDKVADLNEELTKQKAEAQVDIRKGMAQTLLRNIVLPRDEELQVAGNKALQGILGLSGSSTEVGAICGELTQILEQYGQHKEQTTEQLNDALKAQLQQQFTANGQEIPDNINPSMHPQYAEEMSKMMTSLNNQYNDAMDQRKEMILQQFTMG